MFLGFGEKERDRDKRDTRELINVVLASYDQIQANIDGIERRMTRLEHQMGLAISGLTATIERVKQMGKVQDDLRDGIAGLTDSVNQLIDKQADTSADVTDMATLAAVTALKQKVDDVLAPPSSPVVGSPVVGSPVVGSPVVGSPVVGEPTA